MPPPESHRSFRATQATAWLESLLRHYGWRLPAHDLREFTAYIEEIQDSAVAAHVGALAGLAALVTGGTGGTGGISGNFSAPDAAADRA